MNINYELIAAAQEFINRHYNDDDINHNTHEDCEAVEIWDDAIFDEF